MNDAIFALATAPGRAAVAVVRVSGPDLRNLLTRLCNRLPPPRQATLRTIRSESGEAIDQGLVLWFPGPGSFTGEDVFELQLHGGVAIVEAVSTALSAAGARPAHAGEFTRRAFEAGRLDLSQAEAVADLVDAETEAQRRQALLQLGGALAVRRDAWRSALIEALAFLNAQIDFSEEDVPQDVAERAIMPLRGLLGELDAALSDVRGERVRDGLRIALVGAPNAGKSSLFNALLGREAAIVTPTPGTTRDIIEAPLTIRGYRVILADMAGLRDAGDEIEAEGIRRAKAWAETADLRLVLRDPWSVPAKGAAESFTANSDVLVLTKSDQNHGVQLFDYSLLGVTVIPTSVVTPHGLDELKLFLENWVTLSVAGADFPAVTRIRHRRLLETARDHVRRGLSRSLGDAELIAEDVRSAAYALEQLSGRVDAEAVLDRIFASFCIGK